jgi:hypothetical protein
MPSDDLAGHLSATSNLALIWRWQFSSAWTFIPVPTEPKANPQCGFMILKLVPRLCWHLTKLEPGELPRRVSYCKENKPLICGVSKDIWSDTLPPLKAWQSLNQVDTKRINQKLQFSGWPCQVRVYSPPILIPQFEVINDSKGDFRLLRLGIERGKRPRQ